MRRVWILALLTGWMVMAAQAASVVYEVYRIQPGDTVEAIATRYQTTVDELEQLNPRIRSGKLVQDDLLTVPVRKPDSPVAAEQPQRPPATTAANGANGAAGMRGRPTPRLLGPDGQPTDGHANVVGQGNGNDPNVITPGSNGAAGLNGGGGAPPGSLKKVFNANGAVGRLGLTVSNETPIYRRAGEQAPVYRCARGSRLVVTRQLDDWYGVLMNDGSTCWVEAQFVDLTATELLPAGSTVEDPGSELGRRVIATAMTYLGTPYRWGGNSHRGIDCSGLVQQCLLAQGIKLPRVSGEQYKVGTPVPWNQLQPGDKVFFSAKGHHADHVGIYVGNGQFIHASGSRRMVCIDNLFDGRYWRIFIGARR